MAVFVRPRGNSFELRVSHSLIPTYYDTFPTEAEARDYGARLQAMLDRGVVLPEFLAKSEERTPTVAVAIREHLSGSVAPSTAALLVLLREELATLRVSGVTYRWVEGWVAGMKDRRLAPGSIRKRVSALGVCLDAHHARAGKPWINPLRQLPRGYAGYGDDDAARLAAAGKEPRADVHRDRRLGADEEKCIRAALAGEKRPDRERPLELPEGPALAMLFDLIVDTGLRLREAYTLRIMQVDTARGTLNVQGSKPRKGAVKLRQVPLKPALRVRLGAFVEGRAGMVFPWWSGKEDELDGVTSRLSRAFARLFDYAGCPDLTEHDLRHEATCRWVELRDARGGWMFSDTEICKIMGWSSTNMMLRYASLRGSDLAARLHGG